MRQWLIRKFFYPSNQGRPIRRDPRHGTIDRDIQWSVHYMKPRSLGARVALEDTMQERRNRA